MKSQGVDVPGEFGSNRGKATMALDYILDEFPKDVEALTVSQVNAAIKKHLDPQKMVLVKAGTVE